jgi:hypothetical protein
MDKQVIRERITRILRRLGLLTDERVETIVALLDDETPSDFRALAEVGLPFAAGATTRQILDYIAPRLGKRRMDRELRDYIMLPLREVGILLRGYADTKNGRVKLHFWEPKSPANVYVLNPDFRKLLDREEAEFPDAVRAWENADNERKRRIASAEAAALAAGKDDRLVSIALSLYCPRFLVGYQVVFVDDTDGQRIAAEWKEAVERLRLPLDLASRWPDIILNVPGSNWCWIVDCVETDGEVDPVRRDEIFEAFKDRKLIVRGFTTVYRTAKRFAARQAEVDNIAPETYVWIAELGGAQFRKEPLPQA